MTDVHEIRRDGKIVATVPTPQDVLPWFHRNTPQSMDWALMHEGYSVTSRPSEESIGFPDEDGNYS